MNKKIKIVDYTRKGKKTRYEYLNLTKWQVFKLKVTRFLKKCLMILFLLGMVWVLAQIIHNYYPEYKVVEKEVVLDNLKEKIDQLRGELVNDIWNNERVGHTQEDALITWDPNSNHKSVEIASLGTCQYKIPTLQGDWLDHRGEKLTRKQAVMIALDDEKCKSIMSEVITEEPNGWKQWFNSGVKANAKYRLDIINSLIK